MDKPVDLEAVRKEPCKNVIELLEELLDKARTGEIRAVAVASASAGATGATYRRCADVPYSDLYLGVARLQRLMLADADPS